jgi:hypothetical protein
VSKPARVQSIEALDAFRATLLVYLDKAQRILDDTMNDVVRTRVWLETDRRLFWRNQYRDKSKLLAQAEAELLTAKLSGHPEAIQDRRLAVNRAKRALEEAEAGRDRLERWIRHFEPEVESRTQVVTQLRQVLSHDMHKAVAFLDAAAGTLSEYAGLVPPPAEGQPPPAVTSDAGPRSEPEVPA